MGNFITRLILDFFVAFGMVIGGALIGGVGATFVMQPPSDTMLRVAEKLKIWAVVAAIGGTIEPIRVIETNFLEGHLSPAIKQILYLLSAFLGAHMGTVLMKWICQGNLDQ